MVQIMDIEFSDIEISASSTGHTNSIAFYNLSGQIMSNVYLLGDYTQGPMNELLADFLPSGKKVVKTFGGGDRVITYSVTWKVDGFPGSSSILSLAGSYLVKDIFVKYKNFESHRPIWHSL